MVYMLFQTGTIINNMHLLSEQITFEISVISNYWKDPPVLAIYIDNLQKIQKSIIEQSTVIKFNHKLTMGSHVLQIDRTGKSDQQVRKNELGIFEGQDLIIDYIKIDGINIRNIIWTNAYYKPEYPESWATEQRSQGMELEQMVLGETHLGHNGRWSLEFTSPFYIFLMNWMGG